MKSICTRIGAVGTPLALLIALLIAAPSATAQQDGVVKWTFKTGDNVNSGPAIAPDGTIYFGSSDTNLYALNPAGTLKWKFQTGYIVASDPVIGRDGTIYLGALDDYLYAINPDGTLKWTFHIGDWMASPALALDGTIYVGSNDGHLYAVNPDGTLKWTYVASAMVRDLAVAPDGTIYAAEGLLGSNLHAVNPDGTGKWIYSGGTGSSSSPAIGVDGTVYVGFTSRLLAINPDGTLKWSYTTGGNTTSPAIGADGTLYVGWWGSTGGSLHAVNPDGTGKWEYPTGHWTEASPAIGADGTIFVGSRDMRIIALNPSGTLKKAFRTGGRIICDAAIAPDGTLYIGSWDDKLYAINTGCGGLAKSPWPMSHRNPRHTGRDPRALPAVKVNGSEADIAVPSATPLDFTISLAPGDVGGIMADWWIFVVRDGNTPFWWEWPGRWTSSLTPVRGLAYPVVALNDMPIFQSALPAGTWDFSFAVDGWNNAFEGTAIDTITVTVY